MDGLQNLVNKPPAIPEGSVGDGLVAGLNFAFAVLGAIALIMITLQGTRYALSGGDPGKTTQARNGIIYALVGLVVAIMGGSITNFVLTKVLPASGGQAEVTGTLVRVAGLIALVTGVISVIMIIISGYRYVLSNGDAAKAASARNGIIYALVGAVIAGVAGPIIVYVLGRIV